MCDLLATADTAYRYEIVIISSDLIEDPPLNCELCGGCQPDVDILLQILSGFRMIEALLLILLGPIPVHVCLWSMTSDSARKLLDAAPGIKVKDRFSSWFLRSFSSSFVCPPPCPQRFVLVFIEPPYLSSSKHNP